MSIVNSFPTIAGVAKWGEILYNQKTLASGGVWVENLPQKTKTVTAGWLRSGFGRFLGAEAALCISAFFAYPLSRLRYDPGGGGGFPAGFFTGVSAASYGMELAGFGGVFPL